ncbi:MAG: aminomethyl-transferring glycine dehydrogenase subunit GcvPA [Chloroflexota bacterium]|nr:aminomethyl-transferring glycine dehydrogenase subunit GcvPA [Chloroflexota bacterium]
MSYIPHTDVERQQMLAAIGVTTIEDLFEAVPSRYRFPKLNLPSAMSELEVAQEMQALADANEHGADFALFRGAGAYHHYIPAAVNHILLRGEFYTAYTPYQPEMSQGTLQAIYEYQSMLCALTGMDAANASHYDGATSLAEAVTVALEVGRRKRTKIVLHPAIHPDYRAVARTYHQGNGIEFVGDTGKTPEKTSADDLIKLIDDNTAMVAVQYPNFFGAIEDFSKLVEATHNAGALITFVVNPMALALFNPPGQMGADMVVGEGQPLGIPLSYGGPYLGFFAVRDEYVRKIAGRIVGESLDKEGRRAFVMTLRPREQDIRRDKATSNICTNQGLMALAACVYLSLMGRNGLRKVAEINYHRAHYAAKQINKIKGYKVTTTKPFFNEFTVKTTKPIGEINAALIERGIIGGVDLESYYPKLKDHMLIAVTEMNSKDEIDTLVEALKDIAS